MSGDLTGDFEQVTVNNELHIKVPPRSYLIYLEDQVSQASLPLELIEFNGALRQDVVEFVSDRSRQCTDRTQFLNLQQLRFQAFNLLRQVRDLRERVRAAISLQC